MMNHNHDEHPIEATGRSPDEMERIAGLAVGLSDAIHNLDTGTGRAVSALRRRQLRNQKILYAVVILAIVTALALGGVFFTLLRVNDNTEQVKRNEHRISALEHRASNEVLCPLYANLLQQETLPPPPNLNPKQLLDRAQGFQNVHDGYRVLHCDHTETNR